MINQFYRNLPQNLILNCQCKIIFSKKKNVVMPPSCMALCIITMKLIFKSFFFLRYFGATPLSVEYFVLSLFFYIMNRNLTYQNCFQINTYLKKKKPYLTKSVCIKSIVFIVNIEKTENSVLWKTSF